MKRDLDVDMANLVFLESLDSEVGPMPCDLPARVEQDEPSSSGKPKGGVTNFKFVTVKDKEGKETQKTTPLPMADILKNTLDRTNNFPRRVGPALFYDDPIHGLSWQLKAAELFGLLQSIAGPVKWKDGLAMVGKTEFFSELRRTATNYDCVEDFPHEPMFSTHYYRCGPVESGDGTTLNKLLDKLCPATPIDRDLLTAMMVTPGWGGPPGARPTFLATSDYGRGSGKTSVAKIVSRIWGGDLSFSPSDDNDKMKTRILTPAAMTLRVAILDNLKSHKFSWGAWEGLVTSSTISGHMMYVGEASRPNTLTWIITLNGASLSTDVAQRCVIVKLERPKRSGTWEEDTMRFVDENRDKLIADCISILRSEPFPLQSFTRWAAWEKDVLQRLPEPTEAQATIIERQGVANAEADEAGILEDYFEERLQDIQYDTEAEQVFIPSGIAAEWFNKAHNDRQKTGAVSRIINQYIEEGAVKRIARNHCKTWGRGFVWQGVQCNPDDSIRTDIQSRISYHSNSQY